VSDVAPGSSLCAVRPRRCPLSALQVRLYRLLRERLYDKSGSGRAPISLSNVHMQLRKASTGASYRKDRCCCLCLCLCGTTTLLTPLVLCVECRSATTRGW
jgi:hypothetical protein